ncbi:MON2 [Bugula neritina]|uniref:MON2 n=1 Tax=Bugula neritina TaxID=10212 RepID=A0A7J7J5R3_BUGNE|nr:MON2 [Bugula neritina]
MRCCGAEAITSLVLAALSYKFVPPLYENKRLQAMLLAPLRELSVISQTDVRQKQLECALLILQNGGETLGPGWPTILQVIGDGANTQGEVIIRTAFQSMQLVVTDFLPLISPPCLSLCVEMAAKFGLQQSELNISLTAIGLLWNISDYFYQQRAKITSDIIKDEDPSLTSSDQLWMCLYSKFGELCVDPRPAVRKSAGQTLFSTIAAHGDLLQNITWKSLLWKVLFPLLDNVKSKLETAPSERERKGPEANILMHHSRDTAKKQWCETQVLIMAGVSRVFSIKKEHLEELDDFSRAWAFLLQYLERASLGHSAEVCLAALRSFQELVNGPAKEETNSQSASPQIVPQQSIQRDGSSSQPSVSQTMWNTAWKVWLNIGNKRTTPPMTIQAAATVDIPSQAFLCQLVLIFPKIFTHVQDHFVCDMFTDFSKGLSVLSQTLAVPIAGDTSPFLVPTNYESTLTPVQETVIDAYSCLCENVAHIKSSEKLYPKLISHLIKCSEYATRVPTFGAVEVKPPNSVKGLTTGYIASDMTEFSEKCMSLATEVYSKCCSLDSVVQEDTLKCIIQSLSTPLGAKYSCSSDSTWKLAVQCLLKCVRSGLSVPKVKASTSSTDLWLALSKALSDFLFPKVPANESQSLAEFREDEKLDCLVVEMIRKDILPFSSELPKNFIASVLQILNRGSIHSQSPNAPVSGKVRHLFTQKCFETLLQFSFVNDENKAASVSQVAVQTLLTRCVTIISDYNKDIHLKQNVPSQVNEVVSAIQTMTTLISSLQKLSQDSVDHSIWERIISLYPHLVSCIHSKSDSVLVELEKALSSYTVLLNTPAYARK